jgi:branched-chain amino acid transport system substrate-binding protein
MASFGDNQQAAAGAEFAVQRLGAHTAAVLYDDQLSYAQLLEKYFSTSFRAQRGVVVLTRGFHAGDENVKAMLAPLRPRGTITGDDDEDDAVIPHTRRIVPDVVYLAAGPDEAGPLLGKLRKAGYDGPVLGGDSFDDVGLIAAAEATGGRVWFTTHAALGARHSTGAMRRFAQLYASAYGRQPQNSFAGLGFDAVNLVAHAVLEAGSVKPAAVRDALAATRTFAGVTGSLSYPAGGMAPRKAVTVIAVARRPELAAVLVPRHVAKP